MHKPFSLPQLSNYFISRWGTKGAKCKNEPTTICLFVTDRCTLSCKWCPRQSNPDFMAGKPDMTLETAGKILRCFPKATHLSLSGFGEPLLVDDLFSIAVSFRKRPMRISVITNGTLLADRIDEIIDAGLQRVSISINSLTSTDYQSICGGDENTFKHVLKGIDLLVSKRQAQKPYLHISFVLTRNLLDRTPEVIRFAEETGVDCLDLHNLIPHENGNGFAKPLTDDDQEVVEKLAEWSKLQYRVRVGWPKLVRKGLKKPARTCNPLWEWLGVDVEGNTAGCCRAMTTREEYGNLFYDYPEVWNNEFRKKLRLTFLAKDKFWLDCCKSCTEVQPEQVRD